jgi:hypothetical protein
MFAYAFTLADFGTPSQVPVYAIEKRINLIRPRFAEAWHRFGRQPERLVVRITSPGSATEILNWELSLILSGCLPSRNNAREK